MLRKVLLIALLLAAAPVEAQSTKGGQFFSGVDLWWERTQRRNPWMYQIDNEPWKTWVIHGLLTEVGGRAIAAVTPLEVKHGRWIMATFYVSREVYNRSFEGAHKTYDNLGDVAFPVAVALQLRFSVKL